MEEKMLTCITPRWEGGKLSSMCADMRTPSGLTVANDMRKLNESETAWCGSWMSEPGRVRRTELNARLWQPNVGRRGANGHPSSP